jgi:hypothetical protein
MPKISELILQLQSIKNKDGDLDVVWDSLTHRWPVDPVVRVNGERKIVVMNS